MAMEIGAADSLPLTGPIDGRSQGSKLLSAATDGGADGVRLSVGAVLVCVCVMISLKTPYYYPLCTVNPWQVAAR